MKDPSRTNQELLAENSALKQKIKEFERSEAERERAEEALEKRIVSLTKPLEDVESVIFEDLFSLSDLQRLQDMFADVWGVAALITRPDGTLITKPSNFTYFCSEFIRKTEKGFKKCQVSDATLGEYNPSGPIIRTCLSAGLWGAGASISVGGRHIASWLIGQVRNEAQDEQRVMEYAREIGVDITEFRKAFLEVPVMAREKFNQIAHTLFALANQLSAIAYQNIQQARFIAERKHAEEEILSERFKLKTLSDNAPFGMVLMDVEFRFTYINGKFTELFGYDRADIPDITTFNAKAYPDEEYRRTVVTGAAEDFADAKPGERKPRVLTVVCKNGSRKIVRFITSVLVSGDYLMTCEDITELRKLESQLRQAQKTEAIGTLAGGIAHDFNNILTSLMGYATLVQVKMDASDPLRPYVDEVLRASERAADLTRSLLAFSRQQDVTLAPLDVNNIVKAAEKLLTRLLTEDIELHTSLTQEDTVVMADRSQMDQILFNLVTNARDAMPKGGILTIETAIAAIDDSLIKIDGFGEAGKYVEINISDTGMGMDEATQQKIFDPFFTTKEVGKGTGLGLATVYGIVKQHNGYLTVESTLNQGSTFHIYLPAIGTKINETEDAKVPIKRGTETILVAEDNEGVRRFMREALQRYGYTIREAADGEDAVEKFRQHRDIDLIVIDSVMPKKNGRETYEEIRSIDPHIRALFTSGYTRDIVLDKGIEEKEFDFISKPLSLNKLLQKVREVLDK